MTLSANFLLITCIHPKNWTVIQIKHFSLYIDGSFTAKSLVLIVPVEAAFKIISVCVLLIIVSYKIVCYCYNSPSLGRQQWTLNWMYDDD